MNRFLLDYVLDMGPASLATPRERPGNDRESFVSVMERGEIRQRNGRGDTEDTERQLLWREKPLPDLP
ncbi:hypothetical protein FRC07_014074, partial [Ceratobasidium sp. 392]